MFGDIQVSGTRNQLKRPIAVIGGREAYKHLCHICELNADRNDVFRHVTDIANCFGVEFCRVIQIHGAEDIRNRLAIVSAAHAAIRN